MLSKMRWFKSGYDMKWRSFPYASRVEFEAWMSNKLDMLHDEMMNWQSEPKPDSVEQMIEIIEDAVTGELPEMLDPHGDEDKPKKRGKK